MDIFNKTRENDKLRPEKLKNYKLISWNVSKILLDVYVSNFLLDENVNIFLLEENVNNFFRPK